MKKNLNTYILDNHLFTQKDKLLIAVSGGVDSIVLCLLLKELNYTFDIAHCNFQLRGEESDDDEKFVVDFAEKLGIQCHTKRFDTEGVARYEKKGIQETARDLRYDWFNKLMQNDDYQYLITAHHASDAIETFLFNLTRGAGLKGLRGILPKTDKIVRPFLWATKTDIVEYAQFNKIKYREDSSNESDKYKRNYIRHHIVPAFQTFAPNFEKKAFESITYLQDTQSLLEYYIHKTKEEIIQNIDNQFFINKKSLFQYPSVSTLLFEILKDFGFNTDQVRQILQEESSKTKQGTLFHSPSHILTIDRQFYIVKPLENTEGASQYYIQENDKQLNINKDFFKFKKEKVELVHPTQHIAYLDFDKLTFPLLLRRWQKGDSFQPLGMNGKTQKLSDFFKNQKLSAFDKERVWVLTTAKNEICWVVGYRIDERFKITDKTIYSFSITYSNI